MCGLFGLISHAPLNTSDAEAARLRDLLTHRGPDGAGLWRGGPFTTSPNTPPDTTLLTHRRLAVLDTSDAGAQPMHSPAALDRGRYVLIYNGELYNEPQLRQTLRRDGHTLTTDCDTETLLLWLASRGPEGLRDLRGMYALAIYDRLEGTLNLARDPLGIKPLYWLRTTDAGQDLLLFASEPSPILQHHAVTPEPDPEGISAYLTTIRTALGERTLFAGLHTLPPGRVMQVRQDRDRLDIRHRDLAIPQAHTAPTQPERFAQVRAALEDSVATHLRADVPTCCLLSGGLDSAITTTLARQHHEDLRTYCAGTPDAAPVDGVPQADDFTHARALAAHLATRHTEAPVDQALFLQRWPQLIAAQGLPLSTPNQVAIYEVARSLRADGCVVTLSGEGADELFGGYDHTLRPAADHIAAGNADPGLFHLRLNAWCPAELKPALLADSAWRALDNDRALTDYFASEFQATARHDDPLADHLRFQRRVNLTGLLERLDASTMLASVEGRTPFADAAVASLAESLPIADRFVAPDRTKIALREAFIDLVPEPIRRRPKASFPLPFQAWMQPAAARITASPLLREWCKPEALALVAADPAQHWRLAWPLTNLALWADHWWPADDRNPTQSTLGAIADVGPAPRCLTQ